MAAPLPHPASPDAVETDVDIGRCAVRGAAAGFVGTSAAVAVGSLVAGMEPGSAVGFGVFVGSWGGAGFGAMLGGVFGFARHVETDHAD